MKALKEHASVLIISLAEILVGIFLLVTPDAFTNGLLIAAGLIAIAVGIKAMIRYFRAEAELAAKDYQLFFGISLILTGLFFVFKFDVIIKTIPLITIFYAIPVLLVGILKIQWTVDTLRLKKSAWYFPAASALIAIVCGIIIFFNEFGDVLWKYIGITLIVIAVIDIITIIARKNSDEESTEV